MVGLHLTNHRRPLAWLTLWLLALVVAGCSVPGIPLPELPIDLSDVPGIPEGLQEFPDLLGQLGLPDLSQLENLPVLEDLPALQAGPGAIIYSGPLERRLEVGQAIPGTDIRLTAISADGAQFEIAGLRSVRTVGDSLDYDGPWPGLAGVTYNLRLRIYQVTDRTVRAAGVHRLHIENITPTPAEVDLGANTLKFPFTTSASSGQLFTGMTIGFLGSEARGAQLSGLPEGEYPYRKVGDSIRWQGYLRPDIPVDYQVRVLYYTENSARVGGIVTVALPVR